MVADSFIDRTFKISSISKPFCDAAVFLALCRPYQYYNTRTCDSKINSLVIPKTMNKYYTISDYVLGCIFNVLIYAEVIAEKRAINLGSYLRGKYLYRVSCLEGMDIPVKIAVKRIQI